MRETGPLAAVGGVLQQVTMKMSIFPHSTAPCLIPCCGRQPHRHRTEGLWLTDPLWKQLPCSVTLPWWKGAGGVDRAGGSGVGEDLQLVD